MDPSKSPTTHIRINGQLMNYLPCVFKMKEGCLWNKGKVRCWSLRRNTRIKEGIKARTKLIRRVKTKYHPMAASRKNLSVSYVKRRDTRRRVALNLRNGSKIKLIQSRVFVMNLILLMLIVIHGGLILGLQSIF